MARYSSAYYEKFFREGDKAIVTALKNTPTGLTLAQIREITGVDLKYANIMSATQKGYITCLGDVTTETSKTREVTTYNFITTDVLAGANGRLFNYSEDEKTVLAAAATINSPFTRDQLATAMNARGIDTLEKIDFIDCIKYLIKKGNFTFNFSEELVTVKSTSKLYGYVKDIPANAE